MQYTDLNFSSKYLKRNSAKKFSLKLSQTNFIKLLKLHLG